VTLDDLPPFDPKALCVKCGWSIPDPVAPEPKLGPKGPDGKQTKLPAPPPPPPTPPTVMYCDGTDCPWAGDGDEPDDIEYHMHQFCDTCSYEWLSKPLDAG
jgi:hypothetical protein